jgi:hypothetical protein
VNLKGELFILRPRCREVTKSSETSSPSPLAAGILFAAS